MRQHKYDYDAFISHAVEDKIPIANELCARLEQAGLRIWYSGKELGVGDSIEKTIENGLHRSRYGIVILSPTYLAKNWTIREFYTLLAKEIEEHKVILPVLYNITPDELKKKDLLMADRFAVHADRGIDHVVERLVHEMRRPKLQKTKVAWFSRIWAFAFALSLFANAGFLLHGVRGSERGQLAAALPTGKATAGIDLFETMQGLLTQVNSCSCDQSHIATYPQLMRDPSGMLELVDSSPAVERKAGKVTMAVVFQVETPHAEARAEQGTVVRSVKNTDSEAGEIVLVANRESANRGPHAMCSHPAFSSETKTVHSESFDVRSEKFQPEATD